MSATRGLSPTVWNKWYGFFINVYVHQQHKYRFVQKMLEVRQLVLKHMSITGTHNFEKIIIISN